MRVCALASGSLGNSVYVESGNTAILVDAGLSCKEISRRLSSVGASIKQISALLVSHEHSDHIKGVGAVARSLGIPIYVNLRTMEALSQVLKGSEGIEHFETGKGFVLGNFYIHPFSVPHDAADPVQFYITDGHSKVGIVTDLGYVTKLVMESIKGAGLVILEANHDTEMLMNGPYPWELKRRIMGKFGHLSNAESAEAISTLAGEGLEKVILAHLSRENNTPELAIETTRRYLLKNKISQFELSVADQYRPSRAFNI